VLRYGFYVSHYDAEKRVPLWVAHIDRSDSADKARGRTQGAWSRKDDKFTPDSKIVLYAKSRKLPFVTDASYVNANPVELPVGEKSYQKITRGHLASNVEMKSLGDPEEGLQAQKDSFSLANVVPQMQRHNAPIWAKLEDECMEAARRLRTTVGVISGPVFAPEVGLPVPGNEVLYTAGRDGVAIPIPTQFFKVVIARVNGKRVAVGFLIPHRADLGVKDLGKFVVPVRVIEGVTGIDFMPELKANDEVESKSEARWFAANPANVAR
jgi:DNA/RNA endonuclease G (NUC1)